MKGMILVTGACGQIGTELVVALRLKHGNDAVIATDIIAPNQQLEANGPYRQINILDRDALQKLIIACGVTEVYHLAAMLSATGELNPEKAWDVNMKGLLNVLDICRAEKVGKVFWPSSIAVFGPESPKEACPQHTITEPTTVYGISKCAGEYWCNYYFKKYGLDVRSLRYPGLISYTAKPGGGTTDYAVDIFHKAVTDGTYTSFLSEQTRLPMMYMADAIRATLTLMDAPAEQISIRTSYNLAGISFTPEELAKEIAVHLPAFTINYSPDFRQEIADSWPASIDDRFAQQDWNWDPQYDLGMMVSGMLRNIEQQYQAKLLGVADSIES
jgi:nucleoside-diphosphate-sugar epimerase